jgi:hypothetical protein
MKKGGSFSTAGVDPRGVKMWYVAARYPTTRASAMLRFLIGLTLLLLAATLPMRAPAHNECLVDDQQQLEQLLHPREPTAEERRKKESVFA